MQEPETRSDAGIKKYMARIDDLAKRNVTASTREKLEQAQGLYAEFRAGNAGEKEVRELLEKMIRDPEIRELRGHSSEKES